MRRQAGRLAICSTGILDGWFVYCAFTATEHGLVKIGISEVPHNRLADIHHNCPFPIEKAMWSFVGRKKRARATESAIHKAFRNRNTRGEWFKFDYTKEEDKREFHDMMNACFVAQTKDKPQWKLCTPEEVKKMLAEKARRYRAAIGA